MLLAFLLPLLNKVCIVIDFKLNQDFIAKVLCINKDKPMTKCNGKCYLSKQLKKAEKKEGKNLPIHTQEKPVTTLYFQERIVPQSDNIFKDLNDRPFYEGANLYASSYINKIFHPPPSSLLFDLIFGKNK